MELKFRCFGGKTFRPQPEALVNEELGLFSIVTPWGPGFQTKQVTESLIQNYTNFSSDKEATSIYKNLTCLSPEENILRRSILTSNEQIYKSHNRGKHYSVGYEVVCGLKDKNQILFVQIGHPAIYLDREGASLQALGHILDLAGGHSRLTKRLPPLPSQLFGIYADTHCSVFRIPLLELDRLIFISRAFIPSHILDIKRESRNLEHLSLLLSKDDSSMPFWLGVLDFSL